MSVHAWLYFDQQAGRGHRRLWTKGGLGGTRHLETYGRKVSLVFRPTARSSGHGQLAGSAWCRRARSPTEDREAPGCLEAPSVSRVFPVVRPTPEVYLGLHRSLCIMYAQKQFEGKSSL
jgi:hypothetical protein